MIFIISVILNLISAVLIRYFIPGNGFEGVTILFINIPFLILTVLIWIGHTNSRKKNLNKLAKRLKAFQLVLLVTFIVWFSLFCLAKKDIYLF